MKLWILVVLLAGPAMAQEPSNSELCVRKVTALITSQPVFGQSESDISAELQRRGEACADANFYIQVAEQRIAESERAASATAQAIDQQHYADAQRRDARIRAMGRAYLLLQQQQRERAQQNQPRTTVTHCTDGWTGVTCTTN